jgi:hypothetical protein
MFEDLEKTIDLGKLVLSLSCVVNESSFLTTN